MYLITRAELAKRRTAELKGLYRHLFNLLACSAPHSAARRKALATLENIERELTRRGPAP